MDFRWYLRRLQSMSPAEVVDRTVDAGRRQLWARRPPAAPTAYERTPASPALDGFALEGLVDLVAEGDRELVLSAADQLLEGQWPMFGRQRTDMTADIDWFVDFVNHRRAPDLAYSLGIDHRNEAAVGNIKFVWEAARHQHLTVLAVSYALTGNDAYAVRIDAELRRYWELNPFLVGIHWTSGIELGIRMMSWVWIRRLLDGWERASELFENNPVFVDQLGRHHQWLEGLGSHGSSANNHLLAEAAGQFVAATAFPLFAESGRWQAAAADALARELDAQTFADGLNKELASDYHGFVLELALVPWVEARLSGHRLADDLAQPLARAFDALHAVVDRRGFPHRQGDSDDAHGLLLDPIGYHRWASLLRSASLVAEPATWWVEPADLLDSPSPMTDVRSSVFQAAVATASNWSPVVPVGRPERRPGLFADAGLSVMRSTDLDAARSDDAPRPEVWCVMDHGPHGFLSTAAHAHADALAIELRVDGVEVIADPGTYCYHGERAWRDHFRSTAAHATVELGGVDQSEIGGPFLWTRKAETKLQAHAGLDEGAVAMVQATHDGYRSLGYLHQREVRLDRASGVVRLLDVLVPSTDGPSPDRTDGESGIVEVRLTLPLGPEVEAVLAEEAAAADLTWPGGAATIQLEPVLSWVVETGVESPPSGWYSAHFGLREPSPVLVGRGRLRGSERLVTTISVRATTTPDPEQR